MFVEVLYGLMSNSLGLLTDGAHMLLDSSAIIIGLYSSYLSDKKPNSNYNFGYTRSEVLGTFINAVFLVFISLYIVFESMERFIQPKEIHSDHLILISFLGLVVNLIGVYFLHEDHSHSNHSHSKVNIQHNHDHHDVEVGLSEHNEETNKKNDNGNYIYNIINRGI